MRFRAQWNGGYRVEVDTPGHHLVIDEPKTGGGADAGPSPFSLLAASLAA
jgi:putative redox protein